MKIKSTSDIQRVQRIQFFLTDAVNDYIASRTLFLAQLPVQASILSSTAIEKLFKALIAFNGNECKGHLRRSHWRAIRNFDNKTYYILNEDFLKLNQKVYKMRYSEVLPIGFNVVIASREFLAELDYTFITLLRNISFSNSNLPFEGTSLYSMISDKDERLFTNNHILQNINKEKFIYDQYQFIYEMHIFKERGALKANYWSEKRPKNNSFLREGLAVIENEDNKKLVLDLAFYPVNINEIESNI